MSQDEAARRRHPRYAVDVEATLIVPADDRRIKARTRDLSRTGICLITSDGVAPGTPVEVHLVLAFGENAFSEPLTLGARVVWCASIADSFQLGAMFDDLDEQQDGFLEMFLHFLDGTLAPKGGSRAPADEDPPPPPRGTEDEDDPFR